MKKNICKNLMLIIAVLAVFCLTSCKKKISQPYNMDNIGVFLYAENKNCFAKAFSENLFVPKLDAVESAQGVTVDSYFLCSATGDDSSIHKFKNPYTKRSIASLTKIITFLTVLKECDNLDKEVEVSAECVNLGIHSSMAGLKRGDTVKIKDLLYGLMLPSGNDCAMALAENTANSISDFVVLMNRTAEKLGCVHSHFTNPHGLDDVYNYSTAFDLYLFLREACKNELFRKIIGTAEYTITVKQEDGTERQIPLKQTNKYMTGEVVPNENVTVLGGKTGSTEMAGRCLGLLTKKNLNNEEFYAIILYSANEQAVYRNMQNLLACIK